MSDVVKVKCPGYPRAEQYGDGTVKIMKCPELNRQMSAKPSGTKVTVTGLWNKRCLVCHNNGFVRMELYDE